MFDEQKLVELIDDNLSCIEFNDGSLKNFQALVKEFGYCNLAKAMKSVKVKCAFKPNADFFDELRNKLKALQEDEIPKLNFVCTVKGDNYRYKIYTNYLCSDAFIKLCDLHVALNDELRSYKIVQPIDWKTLSSLVVKKFLAHFNNDSITATFIHVADAKDFLDSYLPACFDREKILPQNIIDTCNSPFPRPAIQISKLETLLVIPDNEPCKMIDICDADNKVVVCLNQIKAYLAKVNPAPFNRKLVKAAIKKNLYQFNNYYYYCELEDVDDILAELGDDAAQLRRIFSSLEIVTTPKCTINLEE